MAVSTTTFEERLKRIEARAAAGATGIVTPGGVSANNIDASALLPKSRRSTGYLANVLNGVFMSLCVMALGLTFVISEADTGGFDAFSSVLLTAEN